MNPRIVFLMQAVRLRLVDEGEAVTWLQRLGGLSALRAAQCVLELLGPDGPAPHAGG